VKTLNNYNKNLMILQNNAYALYDELFKTPLISITEIHGNTVSYNHKKADIISLDNQALHNKLILNQINPKTKHLVMFGMPNKALFDCIQKDYPWIQRILIVEPSTDLFKIWLNNIDLECFSEYTFQVNFAVNKTISDVKHFLVELVKDSWNISMLYNLGYVILFEEYYNTLNNEFLNLMRVMKSEIQTTLVSHDIWFINVLRNSKRLAYDFKNIKKFFKGKPIIIVGAGPSLNKNIELLKGLYKKAIIVAGGSAIRVLSKNGITPHFNFAYDGLPREKKLIDDSNINNIPFIYGNQLYFEILENHVGERISVTISTDYVTKYMYKKMGKDYQQVTASPSVVVTAANMFAELDVKCIVFMGQDMCFYENQRYASGGNDIFQSEMKNMKTAKDIFGNTVYLDDSFIGIKHSIDSTVERYKNVSFYNATEGGLGVEGIPNVILNNLMKNVLKDTIDTNYGNYVQKQDNLSSLETSYSDVLSQVSRQIKIIDTHNLAIEQVLGEFNDLLKQNVASTKLYDSKIQKIDKLKSKLMKQDFYVEVISEKLSPINVAFSNKYEYFGPELDKQRIGYYNLNYAICQEIKKTCVLINDLVIERNNYMAESKWKGLTYES